MTMQPIHIDIPAILRAKAPGKHIPAFIIRFLERIVHVKEINQFFEDHPDSEGYDFIRDTLAMLGCSARIEGVENIPTDERPLLFVSNHPLGGLDGMIIAYMLHQHRQRTMKVIVNDLLMYMTPLQQLFAPVNKVGSQSRAYAEQQHAMWASEVDVMSFPAGVCSRRQKGGVKDLEWKPTFIKKVIEHKRDIVPIYFEGKNSHFFYALAYWRKKLGIKINIEMLFLSDEMFRSKGKQFVVHVGQPISYTTFDRSKSPYEWAQYMKEEIYKIK